VLCPLCNAHFRVFLESAGTGTNRPFAEFSPPQPQSHTTPAFSTIPLAHPSSDPAFGPASAPLYTEPSSFFPPPYPPLPIVGPGDVPQTAALSSDMAESYQFSVVPPPDAPFGGTFNGGLAQLHPDLAVSNFDPIRDDSSDRTWNGNGDVHTVPRCWNRGRGSAIAHSVQQLHTALYSP
jgi:hypothetical protein